MGIINLKKRIFRVRSENIRSKFQKIPYVNTTHRYDVAVVVVANMHGIPAMTICNSKFHERAGDGRDPSRLRTRKWFLGPI